MTENISDQYGKQKWTVYKLLRWWEPTLSQHPPVSACVWVELEEGVKQGRRKGWVLLAPCCGDQTPQQKQTCPPHLFQPSSIAFSQSVVVLIAATNCFLPHNHRQDKQGNVCLIGTRHPRVGTCTKIEYPRSLLPRALRKHNYTLSL